MANFNVSNRYATALIENIRGKNVVDQVTEEMRNIEETFTGSKELRNHLASPVLKDQKKNEILKALFGGSVCKETLEFLFFIVEKKRVDILLDIVKRFNELRDEELGIANADIVTATDIDNESKENLQKQLESFTKKKLRVNFKTDGSVIGGFKVNVSGTVIDASLKNQLVKLKKTLLNERISSN